jgi:recombination protein RecA
MGDKKIRRGSVDDNRKQALSAALTQIERQFGKGAIMRMGDGTAGDGVQVVSTGSLTLDLALGIGGLPRGRVSEIYGPESSGKTTIGPASDRTVSEVGWHGRICGCGTCS